VRLATDTIAFDNYCQWTMVDFSFFGAETSPCLLFYHFRYSGMSLLSIVANNSNVCYALSAMDAVLLGRLRFCSKG